MLAYHGDGRIRKALAPLLFNDDDPAGADDVRASPTPVQAEAFRLLNIQP